MTYAERIRMQASISKCLNCKHYKAGSNGNKACSNLASSSFGRQLAPGEKCSLFIMGSNLR